MSEIEGSSGDPYAPYDSTKKVTFEDLEAMTDEQLMVHYVHRLQQRLGRLNDIIDELDYNFRCHSEKLEQALSKLLGEDFKFEENE